MTFYNHGDRFSLADETIWTVTRFSSSGERLVVAKTESYRTPRVVPKADIVKVCDLGIPAIPIGIYATFKRGLEDLRGYHPPRRYPYGTRPSSRMARGTRGLVVSVDSDNDYRLAVGDSRFVVPVWALEPCEPDLLPMHPGNAPKVPGPGIMWVENERLCPEWWAIFGSLV